MVTSIQIKQSPAELESHKHSQREGRERVLERERRERRERGERERGEERESCFRWAEKPKQKAGL